MFMELNLYWQDVVSLLYAPYGWRNRYDLDFRFCRSMDSGFVWRGTNHELCVIGGEEKISLLGLFMDNDKPADINAIKAWSLLELLFKEYRRDLDIKHEPSEIDKKLSAIYDALQSREKSIDKPKEPDLKAHMYAWFDWYHLTKSLGFKCTLEEVARKVYKNPNYVRQLHGLYMKEKGVSNT